MLSEDQQHPAATDTGGEPLNPSCLYKPSWDKTVQALSAVMHLLFTPVFTVVFDEIDFTPSVVGLANA